MGDRVLRVIDPAVAGHRRWCLQRVGTIDAAIDIHFDGMLDIASGLHAVVCRTARILNGPVGVSLYYVCPTIVVMVPAAGAIQARTRQHQ
jgi:hypothetical protein